MNFLISKMRFKTKQASPSSKQFYYVLIKVSSVLAMLIIGISIIYSPGCSDDTISTNYNIDLPRFNWRKINLAADNFDQVWAIDTGSVYLLSTMGTNLYKLSGGNFTHYYIGEDPIKQLAGTESGIAIFAMTDTRELKFIFWNGIGTEISTGLFLSDTVGTYYSGCATDDLGAWICSQSGIVSYNSGNINRYSLDDPFFIPKEIFMSQQNTIRITGRSREIQQMYEFRDTAFVKIFQYEGNNELRVLNNQACGYYIDEYMTGPCFYDISGTGFIENSCISTNIPISFGNNLSGSSFSNLFICVFSTAIFNELNPNGILHWNGNKLSREFEFDPKQPGIGDPIFSFHSIDENNLLMLEGEYLRIKLYIGTRN